MNTQSYACSSIFYHMPSEGNKYILIKNVINMMAYIPTYLERLQNVQLYRSYLDLYAQKITPMHFLCHADADELNITDTLVHYCPCKDLRIYADQMELHGFFSILSLQCPILLLIVQLYLHRSYRTNQYTIHTSDLM